MLCFNAMGAMALKIKSIKAFLMGVFCFILYSVSMKFPPVTPVKIYPEYGSKVSLGGNFLLNLT